MRLAAPSGCFSANSSPAANARSLAATTSAPLRANFRRMPLSSACCATPNQPASSPSTTVALALSVPEAARAISAMGTARASIGRTPFQGQPVGRHPARGVVEDGRAAVHGQFGPEPQEVVPVEGHRDVEGPPALRTGVVAMRMRHEASPPRICEPKLLVMRP